VAVGRLESDKGDKKRGKEPGKWLTGCPEMADKLASHGSRVPLYIRLSPLFFWYVCPVAPLSLSIGFIGLHVIFPDKLNIIALKLKSALTKLNIIVSLR